MWKKICLLGVAVSLLCSAFLGLRLHLEQRALAAGLIVLGICSGEVRTVFAKATQICMECIGLG